MSQQAAAPRSRRSSTALRILLIVIAGMTAAVLTGLILIVAEGPVPGLAVGILAGILAAGLTWIATRRFPSLVPIGFIVWGLLVTGCVVAAVIISVDEDPPDDSTLRVERLDIPDEQNGFTYFKQAGEALFWPGTKAWKEASNTDDPQVEAASEVEDRLLNMVGNQSWDAALAAEVVNANRNAFALMEKGLACKHFQGPKPQGLDDAMPDYVFDFLNLARASRIRAFAMARAGGDEGAMDQAVRVVEFGHGIERSKVVLGNVLVGTTVKMAGLEVIRQLLADTALPPVRLKEVAARLAKVSDSGEGYADSLRTEYELCMGTIEDFHVGILDKMKSRMVQKGWTAEQVERNLNLFMNCGLVFKPNQTRRFFVDAFRPSVENATRHRAERQTFPGLPEAEWRSKWTFLFGNILGKWLTGTLMPSLYNALEFKVHENTEMAATQALVALKAFKTAKGRLPQSLQELVPEYLSDVPIDDFDGKPIRYSPEKKILYSVGKDYVDSGGFTKAEVQACWDKQVHPQELKEPPFWDTPNPSWPIEF